MADKRTLELDTDTTLGSGDVFLVVDDSSGNSRKCTAALLRAYCLDLPQPAGIALTTQGGEPLETQGGDPIEVNF